MTDALNAIAAEIPAATPASEDEARAGVYALLGALLRDVPSPALLEQVRHLDSAPARDSFALAWEGLRLAAQQVRDEELKGEYQALFIGLGRGELVPYGSWYQTGFLMEQPLGLLRQDLAELGFERQPDVHEPEDHAAALCEVMSQLALDGNFPVEREREFFRAHLGSWISAFFQDMESAQSSVFYKSVARLGWEFFELEARYLEMEI